jgi:hypothetical protein
MTRVRAFAVSFLVVSLIVVPYAFAHKDKEKSSSGQSKPPQAQSSQPHSQSHHSSDGTQHSTPAPGNGGYQSGQSQAQAQSHHNNGEHHQSAPETIQPLTHDHEHNASAHGQTPNHTYAPQYGHNREPSHYPAAGSEHHHVDREHLSQAMHQHPDAGARAHAYERARVERSHFRHEAAPLHFVPAHRVVLAHVRIVPTTYHYRRTVFYDEYAWEPPQYVFAMSPRYGLWDATFLAFALDHLAEEQYALMFYNHMQEPEMQQWMEDMRRSAADNEDLQNKLSTLQTRVATLQEAGTTADPSYVPPDVEDVALSPEVIEKLTAN